MSSPRKLILHDFSKKPRENKETHIYTFYPSYHFVHMFSHDPYEIDAKMRIIVQRKDQHFVRRYIQFILNNSNNRICTTMFKDFVQIIEDKMKYLFRNMKINLHNVMKIVKRNKDTIKYKTWLVLALGKHQYIDINLLRRIGEYL